MTWTKFYTLLLKRSFVFFRHVINALVLSLTLHYSYERNLSLTIFLYRFLCCDLLIEPICNRKGIFDLVILC